MEIRIKNVQIAFPALDKPASFGEGEPAYGGKFIITPNSEQSKAIDAAILQVAKDQWKDKAQSVLQMLKEGKKLCLTKAEYKSAKTGEVYNGFKGKWVLSTRNADRPTAFSKNGVEVTDPSEIKRMFYSGSILHAKIDIWAQDNKWGRRVNCRLLGVMFAAEGEHFGGGAGPAKAEDFEDLAVDADEALAADEEDNGDLA